MKYEVFERKVRNCERLAARNQPLYKSLVALFIAFGYMFIFFLSGSILAIILLILWAQLVNHRFDVGAVKIIIFLGIMEFFLVKALFVRVGAPEGYELTEEQFPQLFRDIEDIRQRLRCPAIHRVLLNTEFNACVCQVPRFGFLGGTRNYLVIGLEMMASLSPAEFRAVLAHELGHISRAHSKFTCWIYRIRETWNRISENQGKSFLVTPFLKWYVPRLNAYSFALSRQDEVEADLHAAAIAGLEAAGSAQLAVPVFGEVSSCYGRELFERTRTMPEPDFAYPSSICAKLRECPTPEDVSVGIAKALRRKTDITDSHPCTADRLALLRLPDFDRFIASYRPAEGPRALDFYLGDHLTPLMIFFDVQWKSGVAAYWKDRHEMSIEQSRQLQEFEQTHDVAALETEKDLAAYADLLQKAGRAKDALPIYEQLSSRFPNDPIYAFVYGDMLLAEDDDRGIALLRRAIEQDKLLVNRGIGNIVSYLARHGRNAEIAQWYSLQESKERSIDKLVAGLAKFSVFDRYLPHDFSEEYLDQLRELLKRHQIRRAYLVRKDLCRQGSQMHIYLLAIKMPFGRLTLSDSVAELAAGIPLQGNGDIYVKQLSLLTGWPLELKIRRLSGALICRG